MRRQLKNIFTGWEAKDKIVRPVVVNLLTASAIFLAAVVFKDPIYRYFAREKKDPKWPIYCVMEPHRNPEGTEGVTVDLFVINTEAQNYTGEQLDRLANEPGSDELSKVSPVIRVAPEEGLSPDAINRIEPDLEFNTGKGEAFLMPKEPDKAYREIRISKLQAHGILKFIVFTTEKRPVRTRGDLRTVPITVNYARPE